MTGIIIAGGKSSRMGQDKAFIQYNGKQLIEHAIDLLTGFCNQIIISTNKPERYQHFNFKIVPDMLEGIGPLGGLHATLSATESATNIVIPCDMPHITKNLIAHLLKQHKPNYITVPVHHGFLEPLCAIYPNKALATIEKMINSGNYKLYNLLKLYPTQQINIETFLLQTPDILNNLNAPTDML